MEHVKKHFEEEAKEFDQLIIKLIPFYNQMIEALILSIPFKQDDEISAIDLGCGTGTISKLLKEKYKNARITCVDFSENMINMAKIKLGTSSNIEYLVQDFYKLEFTKKYDVVISSLALHHLISDDDKNDFYQKIYNSLNKGGIFLNADNVLGSNDHFQNIYIKK